ncbi:uncharacterized protein [Miscanthus floridulus]|uniref:uncharacterized protein isoform X1 n=1 Tax=Miscanthus floridulus TaxID=154761 RepID=UPI0034576687
MRPCSSITPSQCHTSTARQRLDGGDGVPLRLAPRPLPPRVHGVDAGVLRPRGAGRRPGVLAARAGQFGLRAGHQGQRGCRVTRERRRSGAPWAACGSAAGRADGVAGGPSRRRARQLSQGNAALCRRRSSLDLIVARLLGSGLQQWTYFLNKGARLQAAYSVKSEDGVPHPLCIIIAQGESFMRWAEMPSLQNSTLFWRLVQGNGTIEQTVNLSSEYYIAVRNLNDHHDTTVQLEFRIRTLLYNTSGADYRCSPGPAGHGLCTYRLPFLGRNVAVLSSGHEERLNSDAQHVKLSYEPRWTVYVVGSVRRICLLQSSWLLCCCSCTRYWTCCSAPALEAAAARTGEGHCWRTKRTTPRAWVRRTTPCLTMAATTGSRRGGARAAVDACSAATPRRTASSSRAGIPLPATRAVPGSWRKMVAAHSAEGSSRK